MRISLVLLLTMTHLLLARSSAADQLGGPTTAPECTAPSVKAFDTTVKGLLSRSQASGEPLDVFWSKDLTFRELAWSPKTTLPAVDKHFKCYPDESLDEVWLASLTLVCADVGAQVQYLQRLAKAPKSNVNGWALYYAVWPGPRWNNMLALHYQDKNVKVALIDVVRSPNATPGLQRLVLEIQDGLSKRALKNDPPKMFLSCGSGTAK